MAFQTQPKSRNLNHCVLLSTWLPSPRSPQPSVRLATHQAFFLSESSDCSVMLPDLSSRGKKNQLQHDVRKKVVFDGSDEQFFSCRLTQENTISLSRSTRNLASLWFHPSAFPRDVDQTHLVKMGKRAVPPLGHASRHIIYSPIRSGWVHTR